jgi:hypothetical protein
MENSRNHIRITSSYNRTKLRSRADEETIVGYLEGHMGLADVLYPDRAPDLFPGFIFTSQNQGPKLGEKAR